MDEARSTNLLAGFGGAVALDMARTASKTSIVLSDDERATLTAWSQEETKQRSRGMRARIVLLAASGETGKAIAATLSVSQAAVHKWRVRFAEARLDALANKAPASRKGKYTPEQREKVLELFGTAPPGVLLRWTLEALGDASGVHPASVWLILREKGLRLQRKGRRRAYTPKDVRDIIECMRNTPLSEGKKWTPLLLAKTTGASRVMVELVLASYELGRNAGRAELGLASQADMSLGDASR